MKFATALTFVIGILIMSSDGPMFPYINLLGAGIFATSVFFANKIEG